MATAGKKQRLSLYRLALGRLALGRYPQRRMLPVCPAHQIGALLGLRRAHVSQGQGLPLHEHLADTRGLAQVSHR